uniref:2-oxo-4-hydroxy-4-carboxy-5-ureidoimidazoline decarboxylase n=1 Tax=Chromera velia CCMP2878 TaxID=1169474 RepID=A0A0G4F8T0_9ALVE|eukprot:Cvel_2967.t1-p1 / transcript=Cvel_2967.t1 / gene=Cvel_2967 / organism=Chromera_velia_CCMP2878 / gene_product=Uric acid degradation bifunctional protein TTL, putative / transcript_product=Uric acid degradation bifunctional protein TTL, putative / location=Cvel_scaffold117:127282-127743(+) / protein_length=154 / sequence_SO=supercontig / SO=protein_coding / is_pseudo=false
MYVCMCVCVSSFSCISVLSLSLSICWEWAVSEEEDLLEAFEGHPRIGDVETLRQKFAATADLCASEQQGSVGASEETLLELKRLNDVYFDANGFIFIVCATGKSAQEMLDILKGRVGTDRQEELRVAAGEQSKITKIRLRKLFSELQSEKAARM